MFSFSSFYNHVVLMDVSLDIPYKLSYYSIQSKVYSSLRSCFYPQLKGHCKIGNYPSPGNHPRTDILIMISIHCFHKHLSLISLDKTVFHLPQSPLVLFSRTFCILMKSFSKEQQIIHESFLFFYKLYQILKVRFPSLLSSDSL